MLSQEDWRKRRHEQRVDEQQDEGVGDGNLCDRSKEQERRGQLEHPRATWSLGIFGQMSLRWRHHTMGNTNRKWKTNRAEAG